MRKNIYSKWLLLAPVAFLIFSCSDKDDPSPQPETGKLVEATSQGTWVLSNLKFFAELSGRDIDVNLLTYDVEVFKVTYHTTYLDEEVTASGLVILPKAADAVPMISFHRGTTVEQDEAPSAQDLESEDVLSYSALASMGFITAVPDMIGFGTSKHIFHPYYVEQPTFDAVIDMMIAARELAEDKGLAFDQRVFLAGYSQGGYITMTAHKALETQPVEGFNVIASFPGAGGYDLNGLLATLRPVPTYQDPYYLAYIGMSYQTYYDEDGLITSFFNEPYASKIPGLFNGVNSGSQINDQLTDDLVALVKEEVRTALAGYRANEFLSQAFEENSPIDWVPSAPMFMYHGDEDDVVPLINSQTTYEKLLSNGADEDKLQLIIFPGHNHGSAIIPYIEDVVKKLQDLR